MVRFARLIGIGLGLGLAGSALAAHDVEYDDVSAPDPEEIQARIPVGQDADSSTAWAEVISVDPIIDEYSEPVARDVCYREPVRYVEPRYAYEPGGYYRGHDRRAGSTLAGALIGGALGNLAGKGDGRKAATIAGAVIGGAIGNDVGRRQRHGYYEPGGHYPAGVQYRTAYERRCEVRTEYRDQERVSGYDVTYEYDGRQYHTVTDTHPGNRIRVAVNVQPIFD